MKIDIESFLEAYKTLEDYRAKYGKIQEKLKNLTLKGTTKFSVIMAAKEADIYLRFLLLDRWCIRKVGEYPLEYATQKGLVLNAKHSYVIWEEEL